MKTNIETKVILTVHYEAFGRTYIANKILVLLGHELSLSGWSFFGKKCPDKIVPRNFHFHLQKLLAHSPKLAAIFEPRRILRISQANTRAVYPAFYIG